PSRSWRRSSTQWCEVGLIGASPRRDQDLAPRRSEMRQNALKKAKAGSDTCASAEVGEGAGVTTRPRETAGGRRRRVVAVAGLAATLVAGWTLAARADVGPPTGFPAAGCPLSTLPAAANRPDAAGTTVIVSGAPQVDPVATV